MPASDLQPEEQAQESSSADMTAQIDYEELAKKVFELLLQELEIENDRTGRH